MANRKDMLQWVSSISTCPRETLLISGPAAETSVCNFAAESAKARTTLYRSINGGPFHA